MILIPATNALGGDQAAWIWVGVIFAVVGGSLLFASYILCDEPASGKTQTEARSAEDNVGFLQTIKYLFQNLVLLCYPLHTEQRGGLSLVNLDVLTAKAHKSSLGL